MSVDLDFGPAARNRTEIERFEASNAIHYTIAGWWCLMARIDKSIGSIGVEWDYTSLTILDVVDRHQSLLGSITQHVHEISLILECA